MWEALKLLLIAMAISIAVLLPFTYVASRLFVRRPPTWNETVEHFGELRENNSLANAVERFRLVFSGALVGLALVRLFGGSPLIGAAVGIFAEFLTSFSYFH
jgi:hypothetical protein